MKKIKSAVTAGLSWALLVLVASCSNLQNVQITRSTASIDEMKLLQSAGNRMLALRQGSPDFGNPSSVAADLPDLYVKSISRFPAVPRTMQSGDSFTIVTKIKNKGLTPTGSQAVERYYLSANTSYGPKDTMLIGNKSIPVMQPNESAKGSARVFIPASMPSGKYYVISCADDLKNITERNELNNCRASEDRIKVTNTNVPIPLPLNYDFQVTPGLSTDISVPVDLSGPADYRNLSLNLQDILSHSITITPALPPLNVNDAAAPAAAPINMSMYIRIGAFAATVCQDGLRYGPFFITGSSDSPTAEPPSAPAEPSSVNIINSGLFAMCFQVVSDTDAAVHVGDTSVDATSCNKPPANISGTWKGTYTCINHGFPNDIDQPITLTITQDGTRAQYIDDGGAIYDGTVCGNVFRFNRTYPVDFDTERGTFILDADGMHGTKTSTWLSNFSPDTNWGNCTDKLRRL